MKDKYIKKLKAETDRLIAIYSRGRMADLERAAVGYVQQFPEQGFGWKVLGVSRQKQEKYADAVQAYRKALERTPGDPDIHNNLGVVFKELASYDEAEKSISEALKIKPSFAMAYNNLGNVMRAQGRLDESLAQYTKALELEPRLAIAYNNIGNGYKESGRYEKALEAYRAALEIQPGQKEALHNMGSVLMDLGRLPEAVGCFQQILACDAESVETLNALGCVLEGMGRPDEAEHFYRAALAKDPQHSSVKTNLGNDLFQQGKAIEGIVLYRTLLARQPGLTAPMVHLAMATLPVVTETTEESRGVPASFLRALHELEAFGEICGWAEVGKSIAVRLPFYLSYRPGNHSQLLSLYGEIASKARSTWIEKDRPGFVDMVWRPSRERVRMVVICGQVQKHSVWFVLLKGILQYLDRSRFEVIIYHTDTMQDAETEFARSRSDRFEQGPKDWLKLIREDAPDIIFYPELAMDLVSMELAMLRLAPLQVTTWGHPVTSGLPEIDLFFTGQLLESDQADNHYREKLIRLPGTGACSILMSFERKSIDNALVCFPSDRSVTRFLICQRPMKFDPAFDVLYARIAASCNAHFWFVRDRKIPWASLVVENRIKAVFKSEGLDPEQYVTWIDWIPRDQFWNFMEEMDVYLDTPAFSGFTTAWQAAYCGLPIVTIEGEYLRQRLAAGLLRKIDVTDTIASDEEQFVSIAIELSKDRDRLAAIRERLRAKAAMANEDVTVVRVFEEELLAALRLKRNSDEQRTY